jgi:uncharacterized protein (DUF1800 family)
VIQNAQPIIGQLRQQLGMPIYGCQPPTGYSMTADAWVNTGALLSRMNFSLQLVNSALPGGPGPQGRPGGPPPPGRMIGADGPPAPGRAGGQPKPVQVNVAALASDTSEASRQRLIDMMLAGQVSDATRNTLAKAESPQQLVALMLGSPEFQKR